MAKVKKVREIMTENPVTMAATASVLEAAQRMREADIGDVIVVEDDRVRGIVTDRDLVVRGVATGRDPAGITLGAICSRELTTVSPDEDVQTAIRLMRGKAIRRLPVVEAGQPVGVVSIGDLAVERDRRSVLGEISAAPPNRRAASVGVPAARAVGALSAFRWQSTGPSRSVVLPTWHPGGFGSGTHPRGDRLVVAATG
jgi:CBS domain-containing protein